MTELLWSHWEFCGVRLGELKNDTVCWNAFKVWLGKEETEALSIYPPSQLQAMRQLVAEKEQDD